MPYYARMSRDDLAECSYTWAQAKDLAAYRASNDANSFKPSTISRYSSLMGTISQCVSNCCLLITNTACVSKHDSWASNLCIYLALPTGEVDKCLFFYY
jgi:hypothetical protein